MKTASAILFILIVGLTESFAQNSALPPDSRQVKPPQVEQKAPPQQESRQPQRQPVQSSPSTAAAPQVFDKNRVDMYLGFFIPNGKIGDTKLNSGVNLGAGYTYFLSENLGVGVFLDSNIFTSEDFEYTYHYSGYYYQFNATDNFLLLSMVLGVGATLQIPIDQKNFVHASAKLGYGYGGASSTDFHYSGTDAAFILEVGARHKMSSTYDLGATVKYTAFKPTMDVDEENTYPSSIDADLSGVSIAFDIGLLF